MSLINTVSRGEVLAVVGVEPILVLEVNRVLYFGKVDLQLRLNSLVNLRLGRPAFDGFLVLFAC